MPLPIGHNPLLIGVVASAGELRLSRKMRRAPDAFELRLDRLPNVREPVGLRAPLIVTARHPAEGGRGNLSAKSRVKLLLRFLAFADAIDVELRSLPALRDVWDKARRLKCTRICSLHELEGTPKLSSLRRQHRRAIATGCNIFKLVTRADEIGDFITLLDFLARARTPVCVMATGTFGPLSRQVFPFCGSRMVYAPLLRSFHPGQLTLTQLRRLLAS